MYDYVRRQQELQPSMFTTKTFQWMDNTAREPSWVKMYSKNAPIDPLAYSSSSIFNGQRSLSRPGGTLGLFQRSAASLTPHRALLAFRRHRQNSDAAVRPPSGVPSSFRSRRRGFTAPPGSQPPPLFTAAVSTTSSAKASAPTAAGAAYAVYVSENLSQTDAPINTQALPHSIAVPIVNPEKAGEPMAATTTPVAKSSINAAASAKSVASFSRTDRGSEHAETRVASEACVGFTGTSSFSQPLQQPKLSSSFSPPLSPHPRTLCHRARLLMRKVRSAKPQATQAHFSSAHLRQRPQNHRTQQFPELQAQRGNPSPYNISSVFCGSTKAALDCDTDDASTTRYKQRRAFTTGSTATGVPGQASDAVKRLQPRRPSAHAFPGGKQPRVLPRSPLVNPSAIIEAGAQDNLNVSSSSDEEAVKIGGLTAQSNGGATNGKPATGESSSSDDDGMTCQLCTHYRGLEWIVCCKSDHQLCFGCVQSHVKRLLATTNAFAVSCPLEKCNANISTKNLLNCLPPQRMQQLEANRRRNSKLKRNVTRHLSLNNPRDPNGKANAAGLANESSEGFDAPLVVADGRSSMDSPSQAALDQHAKGVSFVINDAYASDYVLANGMLKVSIDDEQKLSASMPILRPANNSAADKKDISSQIMYSELTRVSTTSMDSVVLAASVAADSGLSLSPESVGSRLRRVPKGQDNLNGDVKAIGSPENVASDFLELSTPSLGQSVFLNNGVTHDYQQPHQSVPSSAVYDYSNVNFDSYLQTPRPLMQFPLYRPAARYRGRLLQKTTTPLIAYIQQQSDVSPSLPLQLHATETWIAPEQQPLGYAENMLLNATLFETIRRKSTRFDGDESDDDYSDNPYLTRSNLSHRPPMPMMHEHPQAAANGNDDDGVYIPTWRRPETAAREHAIPLWTDAQYESQSGVLCEAAELNFDLYETLHRRR
ncbi:hypothetical protein BX070DRAFT_234019 [Coemansia spiralis]|nr:hypothetical protein BX070DRAFT_234019 [Coemansia spiralis]